MQFQIRRALTAVVAGVTLASILIGPFGPTAADAAPPPRPRSGLSTAVTLLTGDVVTVTQTGKGQYATDIRRPKGAVGGVHAQTIGKDLYVLPDEVLPYLAAGTIDRRLFNVSGLIRQGYDDQHSDGIPLIVSYTDGTQKPAPAGTTKTRALPSVRGSAVKAKKTQARQAWNAVAPHATLAQGIAKIWLDGKVRVDLSDSTVQIGAPTAWAAGLDGSGVKVAVLDTGADLNHPDLAGRVSASASFVPGQSVEDGHGHGTHVASTVGGSGAASDGLEKGVAPKADLIVGKILANEGWGEDSWVIAGMEWAAALGARVVSMSIGGDQSSDGTDPLSTAVNQLTAQTGALFVIAAGNTGIEASISSPGAADAALTVAATDSSDQLAYFSSGGPRYGDYSLKPDIAAPGVDILAAKAGGTAADGYYQTMSGTSMATPHVSGAAAILAQQHPTWRAADLKNALMSTAKRLPDLTAYQIGAGRVDIPAAFNASVTATGSAYFGFQGWPHTNPAPIDRTITYTNTGDVPVSLDLTVTATVAGGPYDVDPQAGQGTPAPGMFTLPAETVLVPAHATASVTATAHPALGANGRRYLGEVTASAGGVVLAHTTLGMYVEDERHDLQLAVKDRSGQYAPALLVVQRFGEMDPYFVDTNGSGPTTIRLREGTYSILTYLNVPGTHGPESMGMALLGDPEVIMDRDRTVTLDARQAREITATVPRRTEDRILVMDWYRSDGAESTIGDQYLLPPWIDTMFALPTKQVTRGAFEYETRWRKAYPLLTITDRGRDVSFLGQPGSPRYDGKKQINADYLGTGSPADYAGHDVRGRAVIVTRSDQVTGTERAQAAAAAGAELLIVVNDSPAKLLEWVGNDDGSLAPISVVSVTGTTGAPLVDQARRGQLRLGLEGVPNSPYVYDLVDAHPGRIPSDLAYKPGPRELATVNMRFHGDTPVAGGEFRADYRPYRTFGVGFPLWQDMPATRTDYVSTPAGTTWSEAAVGGHELELVSISERHAYAPGSQTTVDFFGPVIRPRNNPPFWSSYRTSGWMSFNVQPWADGNPGHAGYMQWGDQLTFTVFQNGVEVKKTEGWASATLEDDPSGTTHFTLDLDARRDPAHFRLSPRTHTVWEVDSRPVAQPYTEELFALLQLDYSVATDLSGDAIGGTQRIGLTASHLAGATGTGTVTGATLAVSFDDGATWTNVALVREGTGWAASFQAPASGFVSLKASAWDSAGNKITQEITRAYGLRARAWR